MSKERREQLISDAEKRKNLVEIEERELTALKNEVMALPENEQAVVDLRKSIELIFADVNNARRSVNDEKRFAKAMKRINNRKQEVREQLTQHKIIETSVVKPEVTPAAGELELQEWEEDGEYFEPYEEDGDENLKKLEAALGLDEEKPEEKPKEPVADAATPVVSGEIIGREVSSPAVEPKQEPVIEPELAPAPEPVIEPELAPSATPPATSDEIVSQEVLPPETKKSLWQRFKERGQKITNAIFNRDTAKVAGKVSYDTVTSVLGIKLATDAVYGLATGKGDLAQWWKERKETKGAREAITSAYQGLL